MEEAINFIFSLNINRSSTADMTQTEVEPISNPSFQNNPSKKLDLENGKEKLSLFNNQYGWKGISLLKRVKR